MIFLLVLALSVAMSGISLSFWLQMHNAVAATECFVAAAAQRTLLEGAMVYAVHLYRSDAALRTQLMKGDAVKRQMVHPLTNETINITYGDVKIQRIGVTLEIVSLKTTARFVYNFVFAV